MKNRFQAYVTQLSVFVFIRVLFMIEGSLPKFIYKHKDWEAQDNLKIFVYP